jgi:protein-tyrosine phosphatase
VEPAELHIAGKRRIAFEGPVNFRDLGGYETSEGGRTRWGQLYRSDGLHRLTPRDMQLFGQLGIRVVYDLRSDGERELNPDPMASRGISLESNVPRQEFADGSSLQSPADAETRLRDVYLAVISTAGPLFGELYTGLAEPGGLPAVFHCAGGKDRTGLAAALLLSVLGVARETVLDDYELTDRVLTAERHKEILARFVGVGMSVEAAAAFLSAPRWVMAEALLFVDETWGSAEQYLRNAAEMSTSTLQSLRDRLVR